MEKFLGWMQNNRVIIKNILSNVETRYLRHAIYPIIEKSMSSEYIPNQIIKANGETSENFVRHFMILGITQYVLEWAENDFRETVEDMIRQIFFILRKVYS